MSVFDRAMVTMVVWIAFFLVSRRIKAIIALAHQTLALQLTTKELERSNEELGSFASVIAHDLRSPLNTIGLFAQMMDDRRTETSADEKYESLDSIQNEITRMSGLIQRLLTYGRIGSGEIQREACDCEAVLTSVERNLTLELQQVAGKVTHDQLPVVDADPTLLAQLFQNLIENSLKYRGDAPPTVHIAASKSILVINSQFVTMGSAFSQKMRLEYSNRSSRRIVIIRGTAASDLGWLRARR